MRYFNDMELIAFTVVFGVAVWLLSVGLAATGRAMDRSISRVALRVARRATRMLPGELRDDPLYNFENDAYEAAYGGHRYAAFGISLQALIFAAPRARIGVVRRYLISKSIEFMPVGFMSLIGAFPIVHRAFTREHVYLMPNAVVVLFGVAFILSGVRLLVSESDGVASQVLFWAATVAGGGCAILGGRQFVALGGTYIALGGGFIAAGCVVVAAVGVTVHRMVRIGRSAI